ncbi:crossover junction endodeoxyribonuclease RuvC [Sporosarcina newyorkensis 2681]|uniref:Crossover junction endodeoxyribonuclease RuvC n=1 Tax=Sporosarcina newyorkensis 2681 TaxID=1027292 RepID=F9DX97_9BACL|nr:crossover junction endodeoxyribonuclease RuvC [Sporosarcina newyorkensis 2681]
MMASVSGIKPGTLFCGWKIAYENLLHVKNDRFKVTFFPKILKV